MAGGTGLLQGEQPPLTKSTELVNWSQGLLPYIQTGREVKGRIGDQGKVCERSNRKPKVGGKGALERRVLLIEI